MLLTILIANNATHQINGMISREFAVFHLMMPANYVSSEPVSGTKFKTTVVMSAKLAAADVLEQINGMMSKMYVAQSLIQLARHAEEQTSGTLIKRLVVLLLVQIVRIVLPLKSGARIN